MKFETKKYFKIGTAFAVVATVSIIAFQNCGTSISGTSTGTFTSLATTPATCTGTYTVTTGSASGTLTITTEDASGNITGSLNISKVNGALTGSCTTASGVSTMRFLRTISPQYQNFTGTMTQISGTTTAWQVTGTYSTCTSGSCDAGTNTWSATSQ